MLASYIDEVSLLTSTLAGSKYLMVRGLNYDGMGWISYWWAERQPSQITYKLVVLFFLGRMCEFLGVDWVWRTWPSPWSELAFYSHSIRLQPPSLSTPPIAALLRSLLLLRRDLCETRHCGHGRLSGFAPNWRRGTGSAVIDDLGSIGVITSADCLACDTHNLREHFI